MKCPRIFHHGKCQRHLVNLRKQSGQDKIPTHEIEKDEMFEAGGEKLVEFDKLDRKAEEFCDVLYNAFPKLREGGGFTLFKCTPKSFRASIKTSTLIA